MSDKKSAITFAQGCTCIPKFAEFRKGKRNIFLNSHIKKFRACENMGKSFSTSVCENTYDWSIVGKWNFARNNLGKYEG